MESDGTRSRPQQCSVQEYRKWTIVISFVVAGSGVDGCEKRIFKACKNTSNAKLSDILRFRTCYVSDGCVKLQKGKESRFSTSG